MTVSTLAILIMMGKVVKDFRSFLAQKVTIMILYIAIVGALGLNAFSIWANPLFKADHKHIADEITIFAMFLQYVFVQSVFITTFECLYSLKYKLKEREHETFVSQQASVRKYRRRFGLAMFCLIAFDIGIVSTIQSMYLSSINTQKEAVLPAFIDYTLQAMLLAFIVLYITFRCCVNQWFTGESIQT